MQIEQLEVSCSKRKPVQGFKEAGGVGMIGEENYFRNISRMAHFIG